MTEHFLQYVWHFRLFSTPVLRTTSGEELMILSPGRWNTGAGPDFLDARIRIGDRLWAGHVEIHIRSADWHLHGHNDDPAYKNVVLHAVFTDDSAVSLHIPGDLPVFEMAPHIVMDHYPQYEEWLRSRQWIPCQNQLSHVDSLTWTGWMDRLAVERLDQKSVEVLKLVDKCQKDWNDVFYRLLARNFGFKTNAEAFSQLADALPLKVIAYHRSDPFQVEALLFGMAGFLERAVAHPHAQALSKEFRFLKKKWDLVPLRPGIWLFGRIRPAGFPTVRLAQLAALLCTSEHLFSRVLETDDPGILRTMFAVEASDYWMKAVRIRPTTSATDPDQLEWWNGDEQEMTKNQSRTDSRARRMGDAAVDNVIINTAVPALFAYGRQRNEEQWTRRALELLEFCAPEDNLITRNWSILGKPSQQAFDSQALIQLYGHYCRHKQCLRCEVGLKLIRN